MKLLYTSWKLCYPEYKTNMKNDKMFKLEKRSAECFLQSYKTTDMAHGNEHCGECLLLVS
jgi:hypothetical protein